MDFEISDWHGYRKLTFDVNGRVSWVVEPEEPAPGRPWVWRTEFFEAFNTADMALLRMGWHLAYHKVSDMYGCPESVRMMHAFQTVVCEELGLNRQPVLFGFSRGGLYAVNYAAEYPYDVSLLYLDAPVLDINTWPMTTSQNIKERENCLRWYGLTPETLKDFHDGAIDKAEDIAAARIPVIIVAGSADTTVPYDRNGAIFAERVRAAGGVIETIVKPDCGHHPHSLEDPRPITDFIASHTDFAPRLPNTLYRLRRNRKLIVGYFGGSITENGGENGWRGRTTAYFRDRFPEVEITEIQASIGGTGTSLGIYRCDRDLIAAKPDLVFIEFAVNDYGSWRQTSPNAEAIIRKIFRANPYAEIVLVYTMTRFTADNMTSGIPYRSRNVQQALARHYDLPAVDIGDALWRVVKRDYAGDWTPLAPDEVHPNAEGYIPCFEEMRRFLDVALDCPDEHLCAVSLPDYYNAPARVHVDAHLVDASEAQCVGFAPVAETLCRRYPRYIEGHAGDSLTFRFSGSSIGVYWMLAKDGGDVTASVDGAPERTFHAWDKYCLRFNRAGGCTLSDALPEGDHTLTLRVSDTHEEQSEGTAIRIGAFLVER